LQGVLLFLDNPMNYFRMIDVIPICFASGFLINLVSP
jgi:hypothetical protein